MLIMHIGLFSCFGFRKNHLFIIHALIALKPLVSVVTRLIACSARIGISRQTNRQADRQRVTRTTFCYICRTCEPVLQPQLYTYINTDAFQLCIRSATVTTKNNTGATVQRYCAHHLHLTQQLYIVQCHSLGFPICAVGCSYAQSSISAWYVETELQTAYACKSSKQCLHKCLDSKCGSLHCRYSKFTG